MLRAKRLPSLLLSLLVLAVLGACQTHTHRVGTGPLGAGSDSMRQFYVLFGLIRISEADSQRMTKDATGYEIVTEYSFTDMLIAPLLLPLTMTSRTVTVNR